MNKIQDIAIELRKWRSKNNLSLAAAALKLNISESMFRRWEQENSKISHTYLPVIAATCGIEIGGLIPQDLIFLEGEGSTNFNYKVLCSQIIAAKDDIITLQKHKIETLEDELRLFKNKVSSQK